VVFLVLAPGCYQEVDSREPEPIVEQPASETTKSDARNVEFESVLDWTEMRSASPECDKVLLEYDRLLEEHRLGLAALLIPEDILTVGLCYQVAGENELARDHLEAAEMDPRTKQRASRALRELPPE
jgi:hypothetical protein